MTARSRQARHAAMVRHATRRILDAYASATESDLADGLAWYDRARDASSDIARDTGLTVDTVAGIVAALSPRNRWDVNVRQARRVAEAIAEGRRCPRVSTKANRATAWDIAQGAIPSERLRGPKTNRFYRNIVGDNRAVTIDVWAARIAEGKDNPNAPSGSRYDALERAYQRAADIVGIPARDLQAATWVAVRGSAL